jgi:sugar lactone lactonase YvrE
MRYVFSSGPQAPAGLAGRRSLRVEALEDRLAPNDLLGAAARWSWLGQFLDVPGDLTAEAVAVEPGSAKRARGGHPPAQEAAGPASALLLRGLLGNSSGVTGGRWASPPSSAGVVAAPAPQTALHESEVDPFAAFLQPNRPWPGREPAGLAGTLPAQVPSVTGVSNDDDGTVGAGQLYVTTVGDNSVHRVNPAGQVHDFATSGLNGPVLMDFDRRGNIYVANFYGNTISKITPNGQASTFASVNAPIGVQFDSHGVLYVSSPFINTISKVSVDGTVTPFVTSGLIQPLAMVFDHQGNMYVTNFGVGPPNLPTPGAGFVTRITPDGVVSTIAAGFTGPTGLVFDAAGTLYVASGASRIDKISPDGTVTPFVTAGLNIPADMTFGPGGVLYVANEGGGSISKVTPDGEVSTWITGLLIPQDVAFRPRIEGE